MHYFTFLGSQTGVVLSCQRFMEGGDTRTIEFAATVQHPFPFHGLDLCNFVRPYENRSQRFLCKFLPISLDCQGSGPIGADIVRYWPRESVRPEQEKRRGIWAFFLPRVASRDTQVRIVAHLRSKKSPSKRLDSWANQFASQCASAAENCDIIGRWPRRSTTAEPLLSKPITTRRTSFACSAPARRG